jgi:formamidopyrimidine-DNA glycosylase
MPELPEVETMRRGILPLVGATIVGVQRPSCQLRAIALQPRLATFQKRALGRKIVDIQRLGKRLLVQLDDDQMMVFEPRMTGLVLLADPPSVAHLRLRLDLAGVTSAHLWYWDRRGLGSVRLFTRQELQRHPAFVRLGPDALQLDLSSLRARLEHRRLPIKVALLDQAAVAGIGNLYASEILHVARIHPEECCHQLTRGQWQRLAESVQQVLQEAIFYEGSTLADGTYRTALSNPGRYQNRHRVYGRVDQLCPTCEVRRIERFVQAQRSTFFCPRCQKRRRTTSR